MDCSILTQSSSHPQPETSTLVTYTTLTTCPVTSTFSHNLTTYISTSLTTSTIVVTSCKGGCPPKPTSSLVHPPPPETHPTPPETHPTPPETHPTPPETHPTPPETHPTPPETHPTPPNKTPETHPPPKPTPSAIYPNVSFSSLLSPFILVGVNLSWRKYAIRPLAVSSVVRTLNIAIDLAE